MDLPAVFLGAVLFSFGVIIGEALVLNAKALRYEM